MTSPLLLATVLLLASEALAGPTVLEWLNGVKYVPPAGGLPLLGGSSERVDTCRDCSRALESRWGFGILPTTTAAPLPCCPTLPPTTPGTCLKCGVERPSRIVGGTEATPGLYPWIAAYKFASNGGVVGGCAATLVSANWAVTAAHCVPGETQSSITLILGEHTITTTNDAFDTNRKEVALAMAPISHPSYSISGEDYDIALLKLAESVDLGVYTPACLPAATDDFTGGTTKASVYGWGVTHPCNQNIVATLRETEVTITTNAACNAVSTTYTDCNGQTVAAIYTGVITDRMLCGLAAGKDACQGDSGDPLTVESNGQHTLAGVVSFGASCAEPGIPGVYANVANLRSWVDTTIAANGGIGTLCDA